MHGARNTQRTTGALCGVLLTLLSIEASVSKAQSTSWIHDPATPGDWFEPSNWDDSVPDETRSVLLDNDGIAEITGGQAKSCTAYVGRDEGGQVRQTGGQYEIGRKGGWCKLWLGYSAGVVGQYELSGDGWLYVQDREYVGFQGTGIFIQRDDTSRHTAYYLYLGDEVGSRGTYTLIDGTLQTFHDQYIGGRGEGRFVQMGGANRTTLGNIFVGYPGSPSSVYELHGGTVSTGKPTALRVYGASRFLQTGGSNMSYGIQVGALPAAVVAEYEMRGGEIETRELSVGYQAPGVFKQSAGTVVLLLDLGMGWYLGGYGQYELSGTGVLQAPEERVGMQGIGEFRQTGGTNTVSNELTIGWRPSGSGTYSISAGSLEAHTLLVGTEGQGALNIQGLAANVSVSSQCVFGPHSSLTAVPGAAIHMTGAEFVNESTDSAALAGLKNLKLIFEGGTPDTDPFEVAGKDKGGTWEAFHDNFTHGTVQLGAGDVGHVQLVDDYDNQSDTQAVGEALYVRNLTVGPGSSLNLNGLDVYCLSFTNNGSVIEDGGSITEVPPIQSINATYLTSGYVWTGTDGTLTVSDAADIVAESSSGQTTYAGGSFELIAALLADDSAGGIASGRFDSGTLAVRNAAAEDLLSGELVSLQLTEVTDEGDLLAGSGLFKVTGGVLEEAFGQAWGEVVQITFEIDPADIADFTTDFTGVSNITLTPIPEPATLTLLAIGALAVLGRRRR